MNGMLTDKMWSSGTYTTTHTHDFSPRWTHAFVALTQYGGDGTARAGLVRYRYRLSSGADRTVELPSFPSDFAHDKVTSVTFQIWSFDALGVAVKVMTFW